jgi:PIN domain nuclease of toxin-antitoxin system
MRLLLDTHTFLWFVGGSSELSRKARNLIDDTNNTILLSSGSIWELAIKINLGKLHMTQEPFASFMSDQMTTNGFQLLPITIEHSATLTTLPLHHRDPFDRLLIAQAKTKRIPLISRDEAFGMYDIECLW